MKFSNTYVNLNEIFFQKTKPTPVKNPSLLLWNSELAEQLLISETLHSNMDMLADVFSGNQILPDSEPIALAYAGHQFGQFVGQLGDGRAHLLGEVLDRQNQRWDIQLKGSGPTQFSRRGDGRCALGPAVREFIMSEAMHALGVPSTRCLAVVQSGESIRRENRQPGAIVTRVAASHIRIGTFQYFAARGDKHALEQLSDYTIQRHYPNINTETPEKYLQLLEQVMKRLIHLVTEWMRVGFIHGVMNTDNVAISGETIDYGPCAMMGTFNPRTVYSSIDTHGRYAFGNQPSIMQWNLSRFAECLIPLVDKNAEAAIERIMDILSPFSNLFKDSYQKMMRGKLGLLAASSADETFIEHFQNQLILNKLDYTITFDNLTKSLSSPTTEHLIRKDLGDVYDQWKNLIDHQPESLETIQTKMRTFNPVVIPRNHHVESAIDECVTSEKTDLTEKFLDVLRSPYEENGNTSDFQDPSVKFDQHYKTFCGT